MDGRPFLSQIFLCCWPRSPACLSPLIISLTTLVNNNGDRPQLVPSHPHISKNVKMCCPGWRCRTRQLPRSTNILFWPRYLSRANLLRLIWIINYIFFKDETDNCCVWLKMKSSLHCVLLKPVFRRVLRLTALVRPIWSPNAYCDPKPCFCN